MLTGPLVDLLGYGATIFLIMQTVIDAISGTSDAFLLAVASVIECALVIAATMLAVSGLWRLFRRLVTQEERFDPTEGETFDMRASGQATGWNEYRNYGGVEPTGFGRGSGLHRGKR